MSHVEWRNALLRVASQKLNYGLHLYMLQQVKNEGMRSNDSKNVE